MSKRVDEGYSERLQAACKSAGVEYGASAIGYLIDENRQTVHNWINGTSVPSLAMHFKLSQKLGVDPEWLATGNGPGPNAALQGGVEESVTKSSRKKK
jgi:hypothetical protein